MHATFSWRMPFLCEMKTACQTCAKRGGSTFAAQIAPLRHTQSGITVLSLYGRGPVVVTDLRTKLPDFLQNFLRQHAGNGCFYVNLSGV